jgi:hypothetical protein
MFSFFFFFQGQVCLSSSLGGCFESYLLQPVSLTPGQLFPCICTLGTMCNLSLGVWETHLYTLCSVFSFNKKKKKKIACS